MKLHLPSSHLCYGTTQKSKYVYVPCNLFLLFRLSNFPANLYLPVSQVTFLRQHILLVAPESQVDHQLLSGRFYIVFGYQIFMSFYDNYTKNHKHQYFASVDQIVPVCVRYGCPMRRKRISITDIGRPSLNSCSRQKYCIWVNILRCSPLHSNIRRVRKENYSYKIDYTI